MTETDDAVDTLPVRLARTDKSQHSFGIDRMLPTLGPLERRTLETVWGLEEANVREVLSALGEEFAYTTVMTTLDRLYKKGFLDREKADRAFVYRAAVSRDQVQLGFASSVISGLMEFAGERAQPVLACIVDAVTESDRELLEDLERLVRLKKAELDKKI